MTERSLRSLARALLGEEGAAAPLLSSAGVRVSLAEPVGGGGGCGEMCKTSDRPCLARCCRRGSIYCRGRWAASTRNGIAIVVSDPAVGYGAVGSTEAVSKGTAAAASRVDIRDLADGRQDYRP